ncbi:MAG: ABC transporter substrate-binding protein [Pseudomonadota bacterium]
MTYKPTRRSALKLGMAAGIAGTLGLPARAAEPQRGGHFRIGKAHGSTTDTLDPGKYSNGFMSAHSFMQGNLLTEVRQDSSIGPEVAESWEASADAATWTFTLRRGVTFHDGRSVTSADVVASINHHRGEGNTSAAAPIVAPITAIEAPDDTTVVFRLAAGDADFPYSMADYHLIIVPAKPDGSAEWEGGVGTGPYKIESFEPGVKATYVRNESYFKSDRAWFDSIEMLSIIDPTARTNALVTGEVDAIDRVPVQIAARVARSPNVELQEVAGNQHYTFAMHVTADPYSDNNVRQALKYGINRQELVDKILKGYGVVGNDHPIGRGQRFFNDAMEQKAYDPDKAKFFLKEAGLDSVTVDLSVADAAFQGAVDAGVLYAESARAAGIALNVVREPNDGYWSNVWLKKPFTAVYWSGRPTEDAMFTSAYAEGVPWNDTFWANERFNSLLLQARAELDTAKRREMYFEMQDLCANDGGTIVPMFASYVFAHSPKVKHGPMASNWDLDGEKWAERWWFG